MKKVLAFALILAIALGGILFAHLSVSADQEGLEFYPTMEVGDPELLNGVTVSTGFTSQNHLRWHTTHTFGGDTVTEFTYSREWVKMPEPVYNDSYMYPKAQWSYYTKCNCADRIPDPNEQHFILDIHMDYEDETIESLSGYAPPISDFSFPYLGSTLSDSRAIEEGGGRIGSSRIELYQGPTLDLFHHMDTEGVWFVMDYRDQDGAVHYESPSGHGIYFFPWKETNDYSVYDKQEVTPDEENLRLCVPLDQTLNIDAMGIDPLTDTACLLTLEDGKYVMHTYDLTDGIERSRLELMPQESDKPAERPVIRIAGGLVITQILDQLILTDTTGEKLLLTAPNASNEHFSIRDFEPRTGDFHFDGETLYVTAPAEKGAFRIAAWTKDGLKYYGVYNCSMSLGTDAFRHNHISFYQYGVTLS